MASEQERRLLWEWRVVLIHGDWDSAAVSASPPSRRTDHHVESMYINADGEFVIEFCVLAETRAGAMTGARTMYDRDVPADMKPTD